MARIKIDYGIDLGTTNSAICRIENGEPVIKKSDTQKDIMPSCVSINKKKNLRVGDTAYNDMKSDKRRATKSWKSSSSNAYVEFKRTMGTDKLYHSSYMEKDYSSEDLSSEVLKALKSFISDENVNSIVVTVPAKFTVNQKTATQEAAKKSGFKECKLLQEPIAAAMAYGLSSKNSDGIWMVFDFGGGTFDAALIKVEDGIIQVFDTEGDNYLGGKNLDYAIVDEIIIPYIKANYSIDDIMADSAKKSVLRDAMKTYAEPIKIQLSYKESEDILTDIGDLGCDDDGEEIELDMTITQNDVYSVIRPYFQKAVDICKELLNRNNLSSNQLDKIILVGGPTHSPLLRQMLREQISENVDTSIDPMTAVACGAALYASTIDVENVDIDDEPQGTIQLDVKYESTSVEESEWIAITLKDNNPSDLQKVYIELTSADNTWSSGKVDVDRQGNVVEAYLKGHKANSFTITCYTESGDKLPCFPNNINIIQGTKVKSAVLPYNISIEVWDAEMDKNVCQVFEGLEKNKSIPAYGVVNNLRTTSCISKGNDNKILIPIFQANTIGDGVSSIHEDKVANVEIYYEDVNREIPDDSLVNVTLKVDSSEQMTFEAFFPEYEVGVTKTLNTHINTSLEDAKNEITDNFSEAEKLLNTLRENGIETHTVDTQLESLRDENENNNDDTARILQHQKEIIRQIEKMGVESEYSRVSSQLKEEIKKLKKHQQEYGDSNTQRDVDQLLNMAKQAESTKDAKLAKDILSEIKSLDYQIGRLEYYVDIITKWDSLFYFLPWLNAERARYLLDCAMSIINSYPTADTLEPYVTELISLSPNSEISEEVNGAMGRLKRGF